MKGIDAAVTGRLARDAEPRTTKAGKAMVVLNLAVDEGDDAVTWVKALAFDGQADACATLKKGCEVYCEGRLKAEAWARDGEPRVNLTVLARLVQPLGQIGRRRPKRAKPAGNGHVAVGSPRVPDDVPFNDPVPF